MLKKYFYFAALFTLAFCSPCLAKTSDISLELEQLKTEAEVALNNVCDQYLSNPDSAEKKEKKLIKKLRQLAKKADKTSSPKDNP